MRPATAASLLAASVLLGACGGDDGEAEPEVTAPPELRVQAACVQALVEVLIPAYRIAAQTEDFEAVQDAIGEPPAACAAVDPAVLPGVLDAANQEALFEVASSASPMPSP